MKYFLLRYFASCFLYGLQFFDYVQQLVMDIKCNINNYYLKNSHPPVFRGSYLEKNKGEVSKKENIYVKRPDTVKNVSGLFGINQKIINFTNSFINYGKSYKKNIKHTYEHKIVFALIEKELYGRHSIDSYTHDADKMILYLLGFPKSFVSKFHREHSVHHVESGKKMNLHSMLCDNIASSPEFKPEKKKSLRDYYSSSKELQAVPGFGEILKQYNFGEDIDFSKIKRLKSAKFEGIKGIARVALKSIFLMLCNH